MNKLTMGSLFDGIGGFVYSGNQVGIDTLWSSEIDPCCEAVTKHHFPNVVQLGDITKINGAEVLPVDIICGGSPCQDLSVAGKRAGLAGERSGLYMEQIRIIREMRAATNNIYPRYMVWENVPGALSSNKGEDFRAVLEEAARCADKTVSIPESKKWSNAGCIVGNGWSIAWRILDAQFWGVPQRRRRIFLVADFGSERAGAILFEPKGLRGNTAEVGEAREGIASYAQGCSDANVFNESGKGYWMPEFGCLRAEGENRPTRPGHVVVYAFQRTDELKECGVCSTQSARQYKSATDLVVQVQGYSITGFSKYKDVNPTLRASGGDIGGGSECLVVSRLKPRYIVRRLTPMECERLNGYPDGWTDIKYKNKPMSDSSRYRMEGNSVAIPCVARVLGGIADIHN